MVREVGVDGTLAPLDLTPMALALEARNLDAKAAKAGVVGISSLIAERRIREQNTGNLPSALREAAFDRAAVQILDKRFAEIAGEFVRLKVDELFSGHRAARLWLPGNPAGCYRRRGCRVHLGNVGQNRAGSLSGDDNREEVDA